MRVVYDLLGAQNRDHGDRGIARYVTNVALALEEVAPGFVDTYLLRPGLPVPGRLAPLVNTGRVEVLDDARRWTLDDHGVFLSGSLFESYASASFMVPPAFTNPGWRRAAILYDLIPLRFSELYLQRPLARTVFNARAEMLRSMDQLFAISSATADDAIELLSIPSTRLRVIGAGADARFRENPGGYEVAVAECHTDPPVDGLRARYVLNPSGIEPRKNIERMAEAYAQLPHPVREAHQLVITCKVTDEERAELRALTDRLDITPDVLVTGYVSDQALVRLYQAAHLVVFPSLYEGFGLPVLEAKRCGAPVICSNTSSLPEILSDPAVLFDPEDTDAIAESLLRHVTDDEARAAARALETPPFSWQATASAIVSGIEELTAARPPRPRARARVALVSPLPPLRTGIAVYAAKFVDTLKHLVDLTVFVDDDVDLVDPIDGVTILKTDRFEVIERELGPFDRVVTFLGNSRFHVDALEVVRSCGGTVVLHDGRLSGLYAEVAKAHPDRLTHGTVGQTVAHLYPGRYAAVIEAMDVIDPSTAAERGVHLLAGVVEAADDVLVHNDYAARVTELDTGVRPTVLFPLPCADVVEGTRSPRRNHLVTLGILSEIKQPELLLDAVLALRQHRPVTLSFCGDGPEDYVDYVRGCVTARGLDDAVDVRGHLTPSEFEAATAEAAVAVQLRAFTNGESSAAVHDALAAGVPTVVTRLGAMAEYPASMVATVPPGAGADELAATIEELLADDDRRRAMSAEARRFAAANGYDRAARVLLDRLGL